MLLFVFFLFLYYRTQWTFFLWISVMVLLYLFLIHSSAYVDKKDGGVLLKQKLHHYCTQYYPQVDMEELNFWLSRLRDSRVCKQTCDEFMSFLYPVYLQLAPENIRTSIVQELESIYKIIIKDCI
jgi:hypothetical protein